jgi:hypothetical protein
MKTTINFLSYLIQFFSDWEMFQTNVVEKIKTHILCSITIFWKLCHLWDNVVRQCRAGQATDDNMAHVHCIRDTQGYKHTLVTCNIYCLSIATIVAWMHFIVTLYVHRLSCSTLNNSQCNDLTVLSNKNKENLRQLSVHNVLLKYSLASCKICSLGGMLRLKSCGMWWCVIWYTKNLLTKLCGITSHKVEVIILSWKLYIFKEGTW